MTLSGRRRSDIRWSTGSRGRSLASSPAPADDGKLVSQDLVAKATAVLGKPRLPVPGDSAGQLATNFATQNPKAAPANLANALITAYCSAVIADTSVEQALQRAWLQDFGAQVIQTLQSRTLAGKK